MLISWPRGPPNQHVSLDVPAPVVYYINLVKYVQKRLATILTSLPDRPKHERVQPTKAPAMSLSELVVSSTHVLFEHDGRSEWARCFSSHSNSDPVARHWLQGPCLPLDGRIDRPIKLTYAHVRLGSLCAQLSHHLYTVKGLIHCSECGARPGGCGMKLRFRACQPPGEYDRQASQALQQGSKPPNLSHWPCEVGAGGRRGMALQKCRQCAAL